MIVRDATHTTALEKALEALELAGDFIQRERDLREEGAFDEQDEYLAEPQLLCESIADAIADIAAALEADAA